MTRFFNEFETLFVAHLGGLFFFFSQKNPAVMHNFIWVSNMMQKHLDKQTDRRTIDPLL